MAFTGRPHSIILLTCPLQSLTDSLMTQRLVYSSLGMYTSLYTRLQHAKQDILPAIPSPLLHVAQCYIYMCTFGTLNIEFVRGLVSLGCLALVRPLSGSNNLFFYGGSCSLSRGVGRLLLLWGSSY